LSCFALGWMCFAGYIRPLQQAALSLTQVQRVQGHIRTATKNDYSQMLSLETLHIISSDSRQTLEGTVSLSVPVYPSFEEGEIVEVLCVFREAQPPSVSLLRRIRYRVIGFCDAPLAITRVAPAQARDRFFASLRQRITAAMGRSLPSPHAELASGIVFGSTQTRLPADLLDAFRRTGTTHIVAASGYNVSVVSSWFLALAFLLGFRRRSAFLFAGGFVWFYVCIAGFGASLLRAAVMISGVLSARMLGRESETTHILLLTAAGMVLLTPTLLGFDIGFQLTVAATVGLVVLGPRVARRCSPWLGTSAIAKLFSETMAVLLTTTPIVLWHFGTFSTISLVANVLIVPAVPLVMLLCTAVLCAAFLLPGAASFFGLLAWPPLSYLIAVTHALADIPFASVSTGSFSFFGVLLWYAALMILFHSSIKQESAFERSGETEGWEITVT
ncbi:ComEC/Rec2 family competence protein, partial [Patescibacteria group bacterium]|nr:ComEC/Rec2 family competence protein [Patescibacteria group bacterium]